MDNYYQKRSVGKIIAWILVAVLLVAAVGAIVVFTRKDKPAEEKPTTSYQEGMVMMEMPTVRFNDPPGIRFTAQITPELYKEVSADEKKADKANKTIRTISCIASLESKKNHLLCKIV